MFIEVKNLDKIYELGENSIKVLNDVSFQLEKGELCTLLGPSGSGKSTLLNAIGGLEKVERGEIIIDGTDIAKLKNMALTEYRRQKLGFVFQFYNLIPDLNVKENIEVGANISKDPIKVEELLNDLGLWEHKDKFPKQLSGGQQQRCAMAVRLIGEDIDQGHERFLFAFDITENARIVPSYDDEDDDGTPLRLQIGFIYIRDNGAEKRYANKSLSIKSLLD